MCYGVIAFVVLGVVTYLQQQAHLQTPDSWSKVRAAEDQEDFQKALSVAKGLVARQPDYAYGHNFLGYIYMAMGDVTNAETEYSRACALFPSDEYQKDLAAVRKRLEAGDTFKLMSK